MFFLMPTITGPASRDARLQTSTFSQRTAHLRWLGEQHAQSPILTGLLSHELAATTGLAAALQNLSDSPPERRATAALPFGCVSVYVHSNILALRPGKDHKTGAMSKPANKLQHAVLSEGSPLPRVRDAPPKPFCVLSCYRRPFKWLLFAIQDDDRGLADVQPQLIRPIGVNEVQQIVHRVHARHMASDDQAQRPSLTHPVRRRQLLGDIRNCRGTRRSCSPEPGSGRRGVAFTGPIPDSHYPVIFVL